MLTSHYFENKNDYAGEGATARGIVKGVHDENIDATLRCLGQYDYPILLRIGGNNFFKLRELGENLNFGVDWDATTSTMLVTSK